MQGSSTKLGHKNLSKRLDEYRTEREKSLRDKWGKGTEHSGNANVKSEASIDDRKVTLNFSFSGQKMWTMEFGKGHSFKSDEFGTGMELKTIRSKMFKKVYANSASFNQTRKMSKYRRMKRYTSNPKHELKGYDERGSSEYNIAMIYTRKKGVYHDIDDPVGTHVAKGLGGGGLNTDGFGDTLALNANPVIIDEFAVTGLERLDDGKWNIHNDDKLYEALGKGMLEDISDYLKDALK